MYIMRHGARHSRASKPSQVSRLTGRAIGDFRIPFATSSSNRRDARGDAVLASFRGIATGETIAHRARHGARHCTSPMTQSRGHSATIPMGHCGIIISNPNRFGDHVLTGRRKSGRISFIIFDARARNFNHLATLSRYSLIIETQLRADK